MSRNREQRLAEIGVVDTGGTDLSVMRHRVRSTARVVFAIGDGAPMAEVAVGSSGAARAVGRIAILAQGTKVRLKEELFSYSRPHLLFHARQGDIGVVSPPSKQSPAMAKLYTIVHFQQCGHDHRLLDEELEIVK